MRRDATPTTVTHEPDAEEIANRKALPDIILTDAEGKPKKLSEYLGNVVILSFWASWNGASLLELPTFAEIEKRLGSRGLKVLTVNIDEGDVGKTFAHNFWAKEHFTFPSFFDGQKALAQQLEVEMLPSTFVIDRKGRIAFSGFGSNDWSNPQMQEVIESLLQETAATP
jgi:peroxiredoxin